MLLHAQIPKAPKIQPITEKAQKKTDTLTAFLVILGSAGVKNACKMLVKLTPGFNVRHRSENKMSLFDVLLKFKQSNIS